MAALGMQIFPAAKLIQQSLTKPSSFFKPSPKPSSPQTISPLLN